VVSPCGNGYDRTSNLYVPSRGWSLIVANVVLISMTQLPACSC
jgi:hypothetical protein